MPRLPMAGDIFILLLLILLNGFFAMAELAVVSSRRVRLKQLAADGSGGARAALQLLEDPTRFLSSVQIGITLIGVLAGVYSGAVFAEPLAAWLDRYPILEPETAELAAFGVVVVAVTYLSLILGELVPKRWALTHPESIAVRVARPMQWVARLSAPLVWVLQRSTELILRLLRMQSSTGHTLSEDEVRALIAEGAREGIFLHAEHRMIEGVLKLADRSVRSIMVPRGEIIWLDTDDSPAVVWQTIRDNGHARYLVCRGEIDELVGVVHLRELLTSEQSGATPALADLAQAPLIVQESTTILRLLDIFRESGRHLAVLVDEHGSIEGIATPSDVLKAIAGELPDQRSAESPEAVQRADNSWLLDGRLPIDEVERLLGRSDMTSPDDYTTLAGFILAQLGYLPRTAESFTWRNLRIEIVDMDDHRIDKVLIAHVAPQRPDAEPEADG